MPPTRSIPRQLAEAALIIAASAACTHGGTRYSPNTLGVLPPQPPTQLWLGTIRSPAGTSTVGLTGAAVITPSQTPGWAHVMISVDNGSAGGVYTWSLKSGSCGRQGDVIGQPDRYTTFPIRADGSGAAEAAVQATLSPASPYAVILTPNPAGTAPSVCTDLTATTM